MNNDGVTERWTRSFTEKAHARYLRDGENMKTTAAAFGVCKQRLHQAFKKHGLPAKDSKPGFPPFVLPKAAVLRAAKCPRWKDAVSLLGVSDQVAKRGFHVHGVKRPRAVNSGSRERDVDQKLESKVVRLYRAGKISSWPRGTRSSTP